MQGQTSARLEGRTNVSQVFRSIRRVWGCSRRLDETHEEQEEEAEEAPRTEYAKEASRKANLLRLIHSAFTRSTVGTIYTADQKVPNNDSILYTMYELNSTIPSIEPNSIF